MNIIACSTEQNISEDSNVLAHNSGISSVVSYYHHGIMFLALLRVELILSRNANIKQPHLKAVPFVKVRAGRGCWLERLGNTISFMIIIFNH